MTEYLSFRCCMCPNGHTPQSTICPPAPILHPQETKCRFVKNYIDERGWRYKVMGGIGQGTYKTRYKKPDSYSWKCISKLPWRENFDRAQRDLNLLAKSKKWNEVE